MPTNLSRCANTPTNTINPASFICLAPPVNPAIGGFRSGFGIRPGRTSGEPTFHAGIDFKAAAGDPAFAIAEGVVRHVASNSAQGPGPYNGYGNAIVLEHPNGIWSFYAHLSQALVAEGTTVKAGQYIARTGNTTNGKFPGMGPHLHFEMRIPVNGVAPFPGAYCRFNIDPKQVFEGAGMRFGIGGSISAVDNTPAACGIAAVANAVAKQALEGLGRVPMQALIAAKRR